MDAETPERVLSTMTSVQLREYRRELEHSLKVIAPDAPVRSLLAGKLFEVMGEQASRSDPSPEDSASPQASEASGEGEVVSKS